MTRRRDLIGPPTGAVYREGGSGEASIRRAMKADLSREAAIGLLACVLAVAAMAVDHLLPATRSPSWSPRRWRWCSRPLSSDT